MIKDVNASLALTAGRREPESHGTHDYKRKHANPYATTSAALFGGNLIQRDKGRNQ